MAKSKKSTTLSDYRGRFYVALAITLIGLVPFYFSGQQSSKGLGSYLGDSFTFLIFFPFILLGFIAIPVVVKAGIMVAIKTPKITEAIGVSFLLILVLLSYIFVFQDMNSL